MTVRAKEAGKMSAPLLAGREKESKHDAPLGFGIAYKKRRKQRSPALERPPGSHEHPDVVFRQYVTAIPIGP